MMAQARSWTDTTGSRNPSDSDLAAFGNLAFTNWYNLLAEAYGQDWTWATSFFSTLSNQIAYPQPADFFLLRLVDQQVVPPSANSAGTFIPVTRYNEVERGNYNFGGQTVDQGLVFRLSYNPIAPVLSQYATLTLNSSDGIDGITFTAQASGTIGVNVSIQITTGAGGATTITIGATPYAVIINLKTGGDTILNVVSALQTSAAAKAVVNAVASTNIVNDSFTTAVNSTNLGGTLTFDFINGLERGPINDMASFICTRLDRDASRFVQDRDKLEASIRDLVETRDVGLPLVAPDNEMEEESANPYWGAFPHRYKYTIEGSNIVLLREGWL